MGISIERLGIIWAAKKKDNNNERSSSWEMDILTRESADLIQQEIWITRNDGGHHGILTAWTMDTMPMSPGVNWYHQTQGFTPRMQYSDLSKHENWIMQ